jgi:DNA-binding response OmpR family regulator
LDASQKKILVAEGDEIVLVLISALLTRYSYTVDQATDAAAAEELLAHDYDAVLLDLDLPNAGFDFLRQALQRCPALEKKLIVLTSRADDARLMKDLRFAALLRKPVEIYELIETVQRCIRGERE